MQHDDTTVVHPSNASASTARNSETLETLIDNQLQHRFELHQQIGVGGMGQVFKARDLELDRVVAIKVIHPSLLMDKEISERLRNEAKIVAHLKHPNIVQIYDLIEISGYYLMILEFIEGHDLKQVIEQGLLPHDQLLKKYIDVCSAVQYAHLQGVIHRDLKPNNIMLTFDGDIKIMDFGISSIIQHDNEQESGKVLTLEGSPIFMAPELYQHQPAAITSDVYALGISLFCSLTARPPFSLVSQEKLIHDITETGIPAPSSKQKQISPEVDSICLKACALNPQERYQSALEMGQDLQRLNQNLPVTAHRYNRWESISRAISFRPFVSAIALLAITFLFIAVYLGSNHVHRIAEKTLINTLHHKVGSTAYSASLVLHIDDVKLLFETANPDRIQYLKLDRPLATLQRYNDEIRDIYLLQPLDQNLNFKIAYARHGTGSLDFDRINEGHDTWSAQPFVEKDFAKQLMRQTLDEKVVIQEELDADAKNSKYWQNRMLGYSPVYDQRGKPFAILVVEVASGGIAKTYQQIEDAFRFALGFSIFIALLLFLVVLGALVLLWKNQSPEQEKNN